MAMPGPKPYDAIVVGARCSGSATAMLLARRGHRVLLLDRNRFPSDLRASTHMIWHSGTASLKRWGLLERLRATGARPMKKFHLDFGEFVLSGFAPPAGDVEEAFAPRRYILDALLLEAAREAGVEFHQGCTVSGPLWDSNRVVGVRYTEAGGQEREERAAIVIGADGFHSVIARGVRAAVRQEHPRHQGTIWAYFSDLPLDDMEFYSRPGRMVYSWHTNDGQTLAGICFRYPDFIAAARDMETSMPAELQALAPGFAERVRAARRETPWLAGATPGVCRAPAGPGWALVGDAGLTMDPISAAGITNAFRDAELLSGLIDQGLSGGGGLDTVLAGFEDQRNRASLPLWNFSSDMARLEPPPQAMIDLFSALPGNQPDTDAYFGIFAQTVAVTQFFAPENVERIVTAGQGPRR
jgi:2-polyprenyl-6-methoxyphenol hydroxylase-like FAD-dependent oxidoreductase